MKGLNRSKLSAVLFVILAIPSIYYLTSAQLQGQEIPGLPQASAQLPTPCPNISTDTVLTYSCVIDSHYAGITINPGVTLTINPHVTITSYNNIFGYGNIINYGTISVQSGGNLYVFSSLTNHGTITLDNFGQLANDATLLNYGGTITNNFSGATNNGVLDNNGTITNNFGTFDIGQQGVVNNKLHGIFTNTGNLINTGIFNNGCGAVFTGSVITNPITYASCDTTTSAITPNTASTLTGSSLVFNATITDTSPSPTTPTGTISWNDGSAGGKFANSATCTLSGSGSVSSCTISYTMPLSAKSVVITGQYAGDSAHSSSSATSRLTITAPDTVAPTTTATLAGTAGTNGWYTSQVTATLTAADNAGGSGVKSTSYSLDGGPQTVYTMPVIVIGDANHTLAFNSTDKAGNTELPHLIFVAIDTTPPVITVPSDVIKEASGPLTRAAHGTVTAIDAIDGPVTVTSNATVRYPVGTTVIQYSAVDLAGNAASAFQHVTITDTTPPSLQLPAQITGEATGPSGATVTFSVSATDLVDGTDPVTCDSVSGSTFPLGATTVNCSSTNKAGNTGTGSFDITVQDTLPPTLSLPSSITVSATSASGAPVTYAVTATDLVDGSVTPTCTPTSGSAFQIGTTTVSCSATDAHGNKAIGSFIVTVQTPSQATNSLVNTVNSLSLPSGQASSLNAKLQNAITSLNSNSNTAAKNQLNAFINQINAQAGKTITQAQATQLIHTAQNIINSIQ